MKILKMPDNIIFDTDNPDHMKFNRGEINREKPLHHTHNTSDYLYLRSLFPAYHHSNGRAYEHPVYSHFSNSFYFVQP